jgi:hypothetical protein
MAGDHSHVMVQFSYRADTSVGAVTNGKAPTEISATSLKGPLRKAKIEGNTRNKSIKKIDAIHTASYCILLYQYLSI